MLHFAHIDLTQEKKQLKLVKFERFLVIKNKRIENQGFIVAINLTVTGHSGSRKINTASSRKNIRCSSMPKLREKLYFLYN